MDHYRIAVIGGGLFGLTAAYYLHANGYHIKLFEKGDEPGGIIKSARDGNRFINRPFPFTFDNSPLITELARELLPEEDILYSNSLAGKKYILREGRLHPLPTSLSALLTSKLFSARAKFALLGERMKGKPKNQLSTESVSEFIIRRTCEEVLEYGFEPMAAEVYAGDPDLLSIKAAYPKLYELERKFGGLLKGAGVMLKKKAEEKDSDTTGKLFTFRNGLQALPRELASRLVNDISYYSDVTDVKEKNGKYTVTWNETGRIQSADFDAVISTIPAHSLRRSFSSFNDFPLEDSSIMYAPLAVINTVFDATEQLSRFKGYGVLIPRKEEKSFIAAIDLSTLFPILSEENERQFTILAGGTRDSALFAMKKEDIMKKVLKDFRKVMGIDALPVYSGINVFPKAIPQYSRGHEEIIKGINKFEEAHPGLFIRGNFRGGITYGDTLTNAKALYNTIELFFSKRSLEV